MRTRLVFPFAFAATAIASAALAAEEPAGLAKQSLATSGSTEVTSQGFEGAAKADANPTDVTAAAVSAGGVFASGNSRSLAATATGTLKVRRDVHQVGAAAAANYGRSASDAAVPMKTSVENYQGKLRYDYFLSQRLAVFLSVSARHDRFQGLDLRMNFAPGLAYYFLDASTHQLWGEVGYDLQHDVRNREALTVAAAQGQAVDKTATRHNARLYLGYDNRLNDAVTFNTGVEYLQGLSPYKDEATDRVNWRLNWDAGVTAKVSDKFSFATTFSVRYDNDPLPGKRRTDALTAANLVYTLF